MAEDVGRSGVTALLRLSMADLMDSDQRWDIMPGMVEPVRTSAKQRVAILPGRVIADPVRAPTDNVTLAMRALRGARLFNEWPADALDELAGLSRTAAYPRDSYILRRGEVARALYVVVAGTVEISAASVDGGKLVIRYVGPGWAFGLLSLIDDHPMNHYCRAHEQTTVVAVPKTALFDILNRDPRLWQSIVCEVTERNRFILRQFAEQAFDPLRTRLARAILILAESYGAPSQAGVTVELRLAKDKIGELLGVSRQSVTKEVKRLETEGILDMRYGRISILDMAALSAVARPA